MAGKLLALSVSIFVATSVAVTVILAVTRSRWINVDTHLVKWPSFYRPGGSRLSVRQ